MQLLRSLPVLFGVGNKAKVQAVGDKKCGASKKSKTLARKKCGQKSIPEPSSKANKKGASEGNTRKGNATQELPVGQKGKGKLL
ncbi:hypothetical protein ACH5RR_029622 [Cinchona calisaya]|uniref:Uncharacterized protein n=1 Tax=Cinchona calisaya TaxID=153742 RepID=A0ABD2YUG9_9GENT